MMGFLQQYVGHENSDPAKVAEVLLQLATHPEPPVHLLLGSDAVHYCGEAESARQNSAERWRDVSEYTDIAQHRSLRLP
jgi:hypothetical protein